AISAGYADDKFFKKVLASPKDYRAFTITDGIIYSRNRGGEEVTCIPAAMLGEQSIRGSIIDQAHRTLGHFGPQCIGDYIRRWY
ncbi:hypothetical protein B0H11DRAFT_1643057, partial [Mycena galericulata]